MENIPGNRFVTPDGREGHATEAPSAKELKRISEEARERDQELTRRLTGKAPFYLENEGNLVVLPTKQGITEKDKKEKAA